MRNRESYKIALGGALLALSQVSLYLAVIVPGVELSMFALASIFVLVMTKETGIKGGGALYLTSTILSLFLVTNKLGLLPYIMFFGIYAVFSDKLDSIANKVIQWIGKTVIFTTIFTVAYLFFKNIFFQGAKFKELNVFFLYLGALIIFVLYDRILTLFGDFYIKRFKK